MTTEAEDRLPSPAQDTQLSLPGSSQDGFVRGSTTLHFSDGSVNSKKRKRDEQAVNFSTVKNGKINHKKTKMDVTETKNGVYPNVVKKNGLNFGSNGTTSHFHTRDKSSTGNAKPAPAKKLVIKNFKCKMSYIISHSLGC